jgi:phosphate uptake regulator
MRRKVIKQGNGTLTITLPKQWTKEIGLGGNDEVEIDVEENSLVVTRTGKEKEKSIAINVDNFERLSFAKFLIACYEVGFDTMTLNFSKSTIKSWSHGNEDVNSVVNFFVGRLIGFEVLGQTKNSIKISNISPQHMKFDSVLSRIFFLIEEYLSHLVEAMESNNFKDLNSGEMRHDNITKLITLASRMIYESKSFSKFDIANLSTILNLLDKITDFTRYAYRYTSAYNKKVSRETVSMAKNTHKFLEAYRHFFNKFNYDSINELDELRGDIKKSFLSNVKKNSKESAIFTNFDAFVETLHGAIKPRIAIELGKESMK